MFYRRLSEAANFFAYMKALIFIIVLLGSILLTGEEKFRRIKGFLQITAVVGEIEDQQKEVDQKSKAALYSKNLGNAFPVSTKNETSS